MASRTQNLTLTSTAVATLLTVGGAVWFGIGATSPPPTKSAAESGVTAPASMEVITVHVSGAVVRPGVVEVPVDARIADVVLVAGGATIEAALEHLNLASLVRDGEHIVVPFAGAESTVQGAASFDINTADAVGFQRLPGIGPVLAQRIVSFRDDHGPFLVLEDLLDVPGIGESKLAAIRDALAAE